MKQADQEKRHVALTSVGAAVFLTISKFIVGVATGSLGILSEAIQSGMDLVASLVTLFAVRVSGKPADQEHTYGHGKVESLSALFETLLLFGTAVWIIYEAVHRLGSQQALVDANIWAFLVITASIAIDFWRSRALKRAAIKYRSQALEADAIHFATDIYSSTVVLFGLLMVLISKRTGIHWLAQADSLAALAVAGIVIWISIRLGKKTIDDLLDAVPHETVEVVRKAANVSEVNEVLRTRVRRSGSSFFADVTISTRAEFSLEYAHQIACRAEESIRSALPEIDVVVHVEPTDS